MRTNQEYRIDYEEKQETHKKLLHHLKSVIILNVIAIIIIASSVVYVAISLINKAPVDVSDAMEKLFVVAAAIFLSVFFHILSKEIVGAYAKRREEEEIYIKEDVLWYIYKFKSIENGLNREKIVVQIPLQKQQSIKWDKKINSIIFIGEIQVAYVDCIYDIDEIMEEQKMHGKEIRKKFVIGDYFIPSLKNKIMEYNAYQAEKQKYK